MRCFIQCLPNGLLLTTECMMCSILYSLLLKQGLNVTGIVYALLHLKSKVAVKWKDCSAAGYYICTSIGGRKGGLWGCSPT